MRAPRRLGAVSVCDPVVVPRSPSSALAGQDGPSADDRCYSVRGSRSRGSSLAWSMASRRVIARPRSHSSSNVASPTRTRRSSRCGAGIGPSELVVQSGSDGLAEQRSVGVQPNSERGLAVRGGEPPRRSRARSRPTGQRRARVRSRGPRRRGRATSLGHPHRAREVRGVRESARHPVRRPGSGGWRGSHRTAAWPARDRRASTQCPRVTSSTHRRSGHFRASVPGRRPPR